MSDVSIAPEILKVLDDVEFDGYGVRIRGQLDRKLYEKVNEVLVSVGGSWNRKAKAHVFSRDPRELIGTLLDTGCWESIPNFGYFPTPRALAQKVMRLASVESGQSVLEPSAGEGALAGEIPDGCEVVLVEWISRRADVLKDKGYLNVRQADFLTLQPKDLGEKFDRVVMNPPFERQADIDHVLHAFNFLGKFGRLVAIMSPGFTFRLNAKSVQFREWVEYHGRWEPNPPGSFKESGTDVNTVTVVIER